MVAMRVRDGAAGLPLLNHLQFYRRAEACRLRSIDSWGRGTEPAHAPSKSGNRCFLRLHPGAVLPMQRGRQPPSGHLPDAQAKVLRRRVGRREAVHLAARQRGGLAVHDVDVVKAELHLGLGRELGDQVVAPHLGGRGAGMTGRGEWA